MMLLVILVPDEIRRLVMTVDLILYRRSFLKVLSSVRVQISHSSWIHKKIDDNTFLHYIRKTTRSTS